MSDNKTWLITGVSTGFGRILAEMALERGDKVIGTVRKPEQATEFETLAPGRSSCCVVDMTDNDNLKTIITDAIEKAGGVDVVVNNAGYGLAGALEELSEAEIRHQMETNFFALVTVTQVALPFMRKQGKGHFLNLSSLAGYTGIPGMSLYVASKFAVEGLSESLAAEVAHLGIKVTLIEPGSFRTGFASQHSSTIATKDIDAYKDSAGLVKKGMQSIDGTQDGDPVKACQAMMKVVDSDNPPMHLPLGKDAVKALRNKIALYTSDMEAWEETAIHTSFDD